MTRDEAQKLVLDYAYGEIAPSVVAAFEAWLNRDPELKARLDEIKLVRGVAAKLPDVRLTRDVRVRIMASARAKASVRHQKSNPVSAVIWEFLTRTFLSPAFMGTAAVLVAVGVGLELYIDMGGRDSIEIADQQEKTATLSPMAELAPAEPAPAPATVPAKTPTAPKTPTATPEPAQKGIKIAISATKEQAVVQSVVKERAEGKRAQTRSADVESRRELTKNVEPGAVASTDGRRNLSVRSGGGVAGLLTSDKTVGSAPMMSADRGIVGRAGRAMGGGDAQDEEGGGVAKKSVEKREILAYEAEADDDARPVEKGYAESNRVDSLKSATVADSAVEERQLVREPTSVPMARPKTVSAQLSDLETKLSAYRRALKNPNLTEIETVNLLKKAADVAIRIGKFDLARKYVERLKALPSGRKHVEVLKNKLP